MINGLFLLICIPLIVGIGYLATCFSFLCKAARQEEFLERARRTARVDPERKIDLPRAFP